MKDFKLTLGELLDAISTGHIKRRPPVSFLTTDQERRLRVVWKECAKFWAFQAYEEFEREICRDVVPESEIAAWEGITKRFRRLEAASKDRAKLIDRLVLESMTKDSQ